ncbi:hypothetical protein RRG08_061865 [Elysia crispata]|uniref:Uncharacterized protein n=1 Tax=Elysia crispata TaxID=231223 RepID=A0AAE0XMJ3_9GAST|nr:hypothetical protein RRG08_061865 [Elysia crispata]
MNLVQVGQQTYLYGQNTQGIQSRQDGIERCQRGGLNGGRDRGISLVYDWTRGVKDVYVNMTRQACEAGNKHDDSSHAPLNSQVKGTEVGRESTKFSTILIRLTRIRDEEEETAYIQPGVLESSVWSIRSRADPRLRQFIGQ